jgi:hypothetical protein
MQIQIAKKTDYQDIINFIKLKYKKKNHILTRNKQIFNFFFTKNKKVNFVICKYKSNVCGILGYLKNDHWGVNCGKKDIWLGWWQVKKKVNGLLLIKYLIDFFKPNLLASYGVQNKKLRDCLFQNFPLDQYIINNNFFKINRLNIKNPSESIVSKKKLELIVSKKILNVSSIKNNYVPNKNYIYFKNKYEKNNLYNYFFMHFKIGSKIKTVFTCKIISNIKHKILFIKVLDIFGKIPSVNFKKLIIEYLRQNNIQHLDLQCHGIDKNNIFNFGFKKNNIKIKNYFEPFKKIHSPHVVSLIINKYKKNLSFFAGDGDNERPRI